MGKVTLPSSLAYLDSECENLPPGRKGCEDEDDSVFTQFMIICGYFMKYSTIRQGYSK